MPFIYSDKYYADIGDHVFPIQKYRLVYREMLKEAEVAAIHLLNPGPATADELLLVHTPDYLQDLNRCAWTERTSASELPISEEIIGLFELVAGGTILAAREAIKEGWAMHLSGGFHHAFSDKAEGFCYLNDLAVAARVVQQDGLAEKVAIIDCDLHQGNGTAVIFQDDDSVFTFSIHQQDLYPVKQKSDLDIHLPMHISDEEYLSHLQQHIPRLFADFKPDLVLYQAGADPYEHDQLGNLSLTIPGLKRRDVFIFEECKRHNIPVAATLGGGYAYNTRDTVEIHCNTCKALLDCNSAAQDQ